MRSLLCSFLLILVGAAVYAAMPVLVELVGRTDVAMAVAVTILGLASVLLVRIAVRSDELISFRRVVCGGFLNGFVWFALAVGAVFTLGCLIETFQYQSVAAVIALFCGGMVVVMNYVILVSAVGKSLDRKPER